MVWIRVGYIGVTHCIANEIITDTLKCFACSLEFSSNYAFVKHAADKHQKKASLEKVFVNILLAIGAQHKEKNFLLAIFKLCKDIFLGRFAHLVGFRSVKVKEFIFNCGEHHLSFQFLQIMYELCMNCFLFTWLNVTRKT